MTIVLAVGDGLEDFVHRRAQSDLGHDLAQQVSERSRCVLGDFRQSTHHVASDAQMPDDELQSRGQLISQLFTPFADATGLPRTPAHHRRDTSKRSHRADGHETDEPRHESHHDQIEMGRQPVLTTIRLDERNEAHLLTGSRDDETTMTGPADLGDGEDRRRFERDGGDE